MLKMLKKKYPFGDEKNVKSSKIFSLQEFYQTVLAHAVCAGTLALPPAWTSLDIGTCACGHSFSVSVNNSV